MTAFNISAPRPPYPKKGQHLCQSLDPDFYMEPAKKKKTSLENLSWSETVISLIKTRRYSKNWISYILLRKFSHCRKKKYLQNLCRLRDPDFRMGA